MPLTKKIIICVAIAIILVSFFFVFVFDDLILLFRGTNFSLESWSVSDDEGFPGLNLNFLCTGTINTKIFGPESRIFCSDFFFKGDHNTILHMGEYKHTISSGRYKLKVYDTEDREIYSNIFSFNGSDLSISSCEQKWWKREPWIGGYSLFEMRLEVFNNGDVPVYPYDVVVIMDSEEIKGNVLPCVIMPGDSEYVDCFVYKKSEPNNSLFTVSLKDIDDNILASGSFSVVVENNVPIQKYSWQYKGRHHSNIPKPEYLYDFYFNLERINNEDYGIYIFDPYDEGYIDILIDSIMFGFMDNSDIDKINNVASFVQNLEYKSDDESNNSFEYPRYPIETMFNGKGGGDCEDKAILTASLLNKLGYDVALLRLPGHMAVGVNLSESDNPYYDYYIDNYYFLETTTSGKLCGFIPNEYKGTSSDVTVYSISSRPLLIHNWKDNSLTIYTNTEIGDFVKVKLIVENLGIEAAESVKVTGGFYKLNGLRVFSESDTIFYLESGMKKEITLSVTIPTNIKTSFKTKIYLYDEVVDEKESISSFPS